MMYVQNDVFCSQSSQKLNFKIEIICNGYVELLVWNFILAKTQFTKTRWKLFLNVLGEMALYETFWIQSDRWNVFWSILI